MFLSINGVAKTFYVDRTTLMSWLRRGCPHRPASGPGKPAELDFNEVLEWRARHMIGLRYADNYIESELEVAQRRFKTIAAQQRTRKKGSHGNH